MKRLKGPDLKMPELKVPGFLGDLFYDLRDRRLLPLIALVVVATAAVPFLLGDPEEPPPPVTAGGAAEAGGAGASSLAVVEARPGLRDYRKRLRRRSPTNPFRPRYTSPVLKGAKLNSADASSSGAAGSGAKGGAGGKPGSGGSAGSDGGSAGEPSKGKSPPPTVLAWSLDVRIARSGGNNETARAKSASSKPVLKRGVMPQTPLPGKKAPVVTYLGPVREGTGVLGKALLLVSTEVRSVFGDVVCASGDEVCQLVEAEPGMPITFVYGPSEVRYTITVRGIEQVTAPTAG